MIVINNEDVIHCASLSLGANAVSC
jgi:hypothetical protein